ncbi:MAG: ROK family protein [Candidatus Gastranaerophilaceae bacterium]
MKALAFDVGGTKIYSAIIDENGEFLTEIEKHSTPRDLVKIREIFLSLIEKYEKDVDVITFSTAGACNNAHTGILGSTGNLVEGYSDFDFQSLSKTKRVYVENDANCAAWAEHVLGASKGMPNSIMLTLGTGVGGGIILNDKLYKGKSGAAGEMHFKMRTDKHRSCTCGSYDCFEAYTSGTGLKRTAEEISGNPEITTYDVIDGIKSGNKQMQEIFDKWQNDILEGCIGLTNIFDPDCIVFSGSMAQFIDVEYLEKATNAEIITQPTKILKATTGNFAGMIGAAILALGEK